MIIIVISMKRSRLEIHVQQWKRARNIFLVMGNFYMDRLLKRKKSLVELLNLMKLKRYNIKKLYSDPARRRMMIAQSTVATQAREGIDITLEEALASYDEVMKEKKIDKNKIKP